MGRIGVLLLNVPKAILRVQICRKGGMIRRTNAGFICVKSEGPFNDRLKNELNTHRIVDRYEESGYIYYVTKGDNQSTNPINDKDPVKSQYALAKYTGTKVPGVGKLIFDSKRRFFDGDDVAKKWFPELNDLKIDRSVSDFNTDFLKQVNEWVTERDSESTRLFVCGDQIIKAKCSMLTLRTKKKVFCIRLHDDTKQQKYTRLIENYNHDLQENIALKTKRIEQIQNDITIGMASIVENRDFNTGGHIRRTSDIVRVFVRNLTEGNKLPELNDTVADCIIRAAPLHDFGKIAIPDVILNKPGRYTPEEYEVMKKHPAYGADIGALRLFKAPNDRNA